MFICLSCRSENTSAYKCRVCGRRVRHKIDLPEKREPLPPFNWVLWLAMVGLLCSVLALQFAGLL